jgi:hypothetical protein
LLKVEGELHAAFMDLVPGQFYIFGNCTLQRTVKIIQRLMPYLEGELGNERNSRWTKKLTGTRQAPCSKSGCRHAVGT